MADVIRRPNDTSVMNTRSVDWYEPRVQEAWTCQTGRPCPDFVTSDQIYGHNGAEPYTAVYTDDPLDPDVWPPEVEILVSGDQDENDDYVGSATVTITATDELSDVDLIEYKINDGEWTEYEDPIELDTPDDYVVQARATDSEGNTSEPVEAEFSVVAE